MTLTVHVSEATFAAVRKGLNNDQQINELIGVIACYNMVSRYLVALQVEPEEELNRHPRFARDTHLT